MKRILIIGSPGAGKSTFARELARSTGLPLYHLDNIWLRENGEHISREEFDIKLRALLETERWIIDGYYPRTLELRLIYADTVFYFDLPEEICLRGAIKRTGTKRDDNPVYETELSPELMNRILTFRNSHTSGIEERLGNFRGEIIRFHSHNDIIDWFGNGKI